MGSKRPAGFVLFPDDVLSSSKIALMSDSEFRAYVMLWCHCWNLDCKLPGPDDGKQYGITDGISDGKTYGKNAVLSSLVSRPVTDLVLSCFVPHPEDPQKLTHPKLFKQLNRRSQLSLAGRAGADGKWHGKRYGKQHGIEYGKQDGPSKPPSLPLLESSKELSPQRSVDRIDWAEHFDKWNGVCSKFGTRPIESISDQRQAKFRARLREYPDLWDRVYAEAAALGMWAKEKAFITFDWILIEKNLTKLLEGNYRPKPTAAR